MLRSLLGGTAWSEMPAGTSAHVDIALGKTPGMGVRVFYMFFVCVYVHLYVYLLRIYCLYYIMFIVYCYLLHVHCFFTCPIRKNSGYWCLLRACYLKMVFTYVAAPIKTNVDNNVFFCLFVCIS